MRLTWRDGRATLLVATAALLFVLWEAGTALTGTSVGVLGAIVFGLGFAACMSDQREMASVYGAQGQRRAPMGYVVMASLLGTVALIAGVLAVTVGNQAMLATLVGATVALWLMATVRHATTGAATRGLGTPKPVP